MDGAGWLGEALMWFIVGYAVIGGALGLVALARDVWERHASVSGV